jgi:GrpB-like predicted nucleotidyltransferase (UPF0157 family)
MPARQQGRSCPAVSLTPVSSAIVGSWSVHHCTAAFIDRMLLFRDHLRADDADRDAYLQVKRDLARRTWQHVQHYADSKAAIVEQIMARASAASQPDQPG